MKKLFLLVLLLLALCIPCEAAAPDKDIIILYTNDIHCGVEDNIGYAGLAFFRNEMKKISPYVTVIDAGDWAQGGTIGAISQGRYILEIMNAIGYEVAVPGNHEFDYGWSQFENFSKNLKCGFISCNLRDLATGQLVFEPYKILNYGKVKVAFVGICTPDAFVTSTPSTFMDDKGEYVYDFDGDVEGKKFCATVQKAVDEARKAGADFVIAVGHLGENGINKKLRAEWTAPFVVANTKGIDAFIDGHSHEITPALKVKNLDGVEITITQTGTKLNNIGRMTINTSGEIKTEIINSVEGHDEKITALVNDIKNRYTDTLNEKLSYTSFDMRAMDDAGNWLVRNGETNLSNFVTDAIRDAASETKTGKADITLYNGGGIRSNWTAGELTYNSALSVFPFNNTVCIIEISGQTILDALEMGAKALPGNNGGFLQVSGLTYTVDTRIPTSVQIDEKNKFIGISGERRVKDVMVNGKPLDPEHKYSVIGTNFTLREGGDGYVFSNAKVLEADFIIATDALAHYMKKFPCVPERYREVEHRIKIIK